MTDLVDLDRRLAVNADRLAAAQAQLDTLDAGDPAREIVLHRQGWLTARIAELERAKQPPAGPLDLADLDQQAARVAATLTDARGELGRLDADRGALALAALTGTAADRKRLADADSRAATLRALVEAANAGRAELKRLGLARITVRQAAIVAELVAQQQAHADVWAAGDPLLFDLDADVSLVDKVALARRSQLALGEELVNLTGNPSHRAEGIALSGGLASHRGRSQWLPAAGISVDTAPLPRPWQPLVDEYRQLQQQAATLDY